MATAPAIVLHSRLVAELATDRYVVVPVARLAERLEISRERAWRLAGEAERAGEAQRWAAGEDGPCVVLTPLAAGRLQLRPTDDGLRWLREGQRDQPRKAKRVRGPRTISLIQGYHDPIARG